GQKSCISSSSGSLAEMCGETMSPVRYDIRCSPKLPGSGITTPESNTRTGSLLVSSYTIIFCEPTIVVRRSLLGASHDSSTWATVCDGYSRLTNATSGVPGITQPRVSADTYDGVSPSQ